MLFSISFVAAENNGTISDLKSDSSSVGLYQEEFQYDSLCEVSNGTENSNLQAGYNVINIHVVDTYNSKTGTWDENGFNLKGATVKLYDSSGNPIATYTSGSDGYVTITKLTADKYTVEVSYSTYEPIKQEVDFKMGNTVELNPIFVPDILIVADYASHNEKIDLLMNLSKRVAYISTTDYDRSREWLFGCANFIHIDMFTEGAYTNFNSQTLHGLLANVKANVNYKIAYTFGTYDESILSGTGMHIVGASPENNTFNTVENTYVGSYFQARDINESDVLMHNMENYLKYVAYLINPEYDNPTLDVNNAPQMTPECGFYHPDLGVFTIVPDGNYINEWILENPGYNADGEGSLNWMVENYPDWFSNILDPSDLFRDFEENYLSKFNPDKKFIAIASYYYGGPVVDSLIEAYEECGRPAFNVFKFSTTPSMSSILNKITNISKVGISTINSLYSWSLSYANGTAEPDLSEMDLAVLKGINEISEYSYNSDLGPQVEWTYSVTFPSFEGVFSPVILSYVDALGKVHVIQEGVEKLVKLGCGWADLKDLNNSDKVVAIVLYNYPPGKQEIGASYLDVFQSTFDLITLMAMDGYDIGCDFQDFITLKELTDTIYDMNNKGSWASGLLEEYVEKNWDSLMEHHQLISLDDFQDLVDDIPKDLYDEMIAYWKTGLGPAMVYKNQYIVIPGVWFGKIFVTFQPSRGWEEVQNYHDLTLPPHQQYVAFYKWLDKVANVNAIVDMGTHGTLEWLPGTNLGAMPGDWTFELTLNPTIYPYIVSNPGEAMVARDRIAALTITHMTPAMVSSELYGNYTTLLNYINYYKDQVKLDVTSNAEEYKVKIIKLAHTLGYEDLTDDKNFDEWLDGLHRYLDEMENDFNTYGLHTLGKVLTGFELTEEVVTIVSSQTKIYNQIMELLYPEFEGKDFFTDISNNLEYLNQSSEIKSFLKEYISYLVNGTSVDDLASKYLISNDSKLYESTQYAAQVIVNIQNNNEWNAILTALRGGYVASGLFADPAYGASIPTGYDGYASDPTRMPSESAYASAVKIVDLLLANYYEQHGKWPELTSLILWGTEISRTEGIGVAEFLYLLGCRPVWADNGQVMGVELLPLSDLTITLNDGSVVNRPRIDVFASIVTNNKNWISWMVTAVKLAAFSGENEDNNYVLKHYNENPSLDRLFGLPGSVLEGTGMSTLIPNTADWDVDTVNNVLMDIYLNRVSYSWSVDDDGNIVISKQRDTYEYLLGKTDLITQNFDSTWRLFDSDDYYDWFGGLYNAASLLKQKQGKGKPDTAFVDIRNKNKYLSRSYEEEIDFEIRSMLTNPKYYGPLSETEAGFNSYASRYQNLFGAVTVSNGKLNDQLGNNMADTLMTMSGSVDSVGKSAALQTSLAWMIYFSEQGKWNTDSKTLEKLANEYMNQVLEYGVACCHHTCKNLAFNAKIIQMSSLTPAQKQQFAEILAKATNTDPLYQMNDSNGNSEEQGASTDESGKNSGDVLTNNTNSDNSQAHSGGTTAAGNDYSHEKGDAKSASDAQGGQDSSVSDSVAYELSENSASKSASPTESSMPVFVIIAILILLGIFLVGYIRSNKKVDDY